MSEWLTVDGIMRYLGISRASAYRIVSRARLGSQRRYIRGRSGRGQALIRRSALPGLVCTNDRRHNLRYDREHQRAAAAARWSHRVDKMPD